MQNLILLCPTSAIMSLNLEHNGTGALRISRIHLDIVTKVLFFERNEVAVHSLVMGKTNQGSALESLILLLNEHV